MTKNKRHIIQYTIELNCITTNEFMVGNFEDTLQLFLIAGNSLHKNTQANIVKTKVIK